MKYRLVWAMLLVMLCAALTNTSAESWGRDCATPYGADLGRNYVQASDPRNEHVVVLGNRLFISIPIY